MPRLYRLAIIMSEQLSSKNNYGFFSRLLHKLVLDYPFIAETIFDLEQITASGKIPSPVIKPIFIAGLARSGTTAVLTNFYKTGKFRSLIYKDMPFVLMPSVWKKISASTSTNNIKTERAHGDGIFVNPESPEAFEEIFWRTFCHESYIFEEYLSPHKIDAETQKKFKLFVGAVLRSSENPQKIRYLSKNNNNLLRLPFLKKAFSDSIIIVPFRNPLQQSISLMNQHRAFCQRHEKDKFSLTYMNWLAHHEFGMGHKPFRFDGFTNELAAYRADEVNYWLTLWKNSYQYILDTAPRDSYFLCYERLCENTSEELGRLYARAEIYCDKPLDEAIFSLPPRKEVDNLDPNLLSRCNTLYEDLIRRNRR